MCPTRPHCPISRVVEKDCSVRSPGACERPGRPDPGFHDGPTLRRRLQGNGGIGFVGDPLRRPRGRRSPTITVLFFGVRGTIVVLTITVVTPVSFPSLAIKTIPGAPLLKGLSLFWCSITSTTFPILCGAFRLVICHSYLKVFFFGHRVHICRDEDILAGRITTRTKQTTHLGLYSRKGQSVSRTG